MRLNEDFPERLASAAYETLKKAYTDAQENLQAFLDDLQHLYARFAIKQVNTNNHTIMFKSRNESRNFTLIVHIPQGLLTKQQLIEIVDSITFEEALQKNLRKGE